ncbi:unnamed protein product [Pylaiella littoralis]
MITVLLGPTDPACDGERCFFSLNNRRLFVFKACREEGLLGPDGQVRVRARAMKPHERERYTVDRCSLQAKFLFAAPKPPPATVAPPLSSPTGARTPASTVAVTVAAADGAEASASSTAAAPAAAPAAPAGAAVERERERSPDEGLDCRFTQRREKESQRGEEEEDVVRTVLVEEETKDHARVSGGLDALPQEEEEEQDQVRLTASSAGQGNRVSRIGNQCTYIAGDISPVAAAVENDAGRTGGPAPETTTTPCAKLRETKADRRRKGGGKGSGGGGVCGGSEGVPGLVGSVLGNGAAEEVRVELSRKQERARSGRRQRKAAY